jgi:alkylation response protein AidB-like acyl-CoA dehydrogenase
MCVGGARVSIESAVAYAKQRKAFGKTISDFGLVREKIANMATLIYVGESAVYRTVGMMDALLSEIDSASPDAAKERRKAIEEYAVECSILKVWGSEMIDYVVDETLQIYAGYGFVEEYPAERAYRDARINRIFEGTNEINRLIITGFLLKRAMSGQLPLMPAIKKLMDEVLSGPSAGEEIEGPLAEERKLVAQAKKLGLFVSGAATQKYMQKIQDQQEVMGAIADMTIEIYAMESAVLRAQKMVEHKGEASAALPDCHDPCVPHAGDGQDRSGGKEGHCRRGRRRHAARLNWRSCGACPSTSPSTRLRCASRLRRRRWRQGSTRWRKPRLHCMRWMGGHRACPSPPDNLLQGSTVLHDPATEIYLELPG